MGLGVGVFEGVGVGYTKTLCMLYKFMLLKEEKGEEKKGGGGERV